MSFKDFAKHCDLGYLLRVIVPTLELGHVEVAAESKAPNELIGQALVRMRVVTQDDVDRAVTMQERLRIDGDFGVIDELYQAARAELKAKLASLDEMISTNTL